MSRSEKQRDRSLKVWDFEVGVRRPRGKSKMRQNNVTNKYMNERKLNRNLASEMILWNAGNKIPQMGQWDEDEKATLSGCKLKIDYFLIY